jgi:hypothetical protein
MKLAIEGQNDQKYIEDKRERTERDGENVSKVEQEL